MMDDMAIARTARRVRAVLERNKTDRQFGFLGAGTFPDNACQGASCLLAQVFEDELGFAAVVVEGRDPSRNESHFWVEAGGLVYDLTADQFEGLTPLYGAPTTPLAAMFPEQRPLGEREAFDRAHVRACLEAIGA